MTVNIVTAVPYSYMLFWLILLNSYFIFIVAAIYMLLHIRINAYGASFWTVIL